MFVLKSKMSQLNKDVTKSQKLIQINSSSIVDLKAELFRKQEQVRQLKKSTDSTIQNDQSDEHLYAQGANKNITLPKRLLEATQQSDGDNKPNKRAFIKQKEDEIRKELTEAEERVLQKSRENLERKAKLYDQISKGQVKIDSDDENILVNFNQKHSMYDSDDDEDEDLVEYVDQFGRTKMVTRHELDRLEKEREEEEQRELKLRLQEKSNSDYESEPNSVPDYEAKPTVSNIHYQHVLEGEVRDHGVGFYSFSEDEQIRRQQMEMLEQLRKETESNKNEKRRIKEKRKRMLRNRLEKIAARKGITLPAVQSDDSDDDDDDDNDGDNNENPDKTIRLEKASLEMKIPQSTGPREWDLGKEGVPIDIHIRNKTTFYSQEKYKEKQREERNPDFAPPQIYHHHHHHQSKKSSSNERQRSRSSSRTNESDTVDSKSEHSEMFKFITEKISEIRKKS
nr:coiled-coil domain-containing protein 174-like [Dermatophagoides farinae]